MILIADSGGTGTEWCTVYKGNVLFYQSGGLPPHVVKNGAEQPLFLHSIVDLVQAVYFYGTGCAKSSNAQVLSELLACWFPKSTIHVFSDLLALAHIGFDAKPGFVSILGTGASMAFYDGEVLHFDVASRGVMLDPGSGTDIANVLHKDFVEKVLPCDLETAFRGHYGVVDSIPAVNIHSTMRFVRQNVSDKYIAELIKRQFAAFFDYYMPQPIVNRYPMVFGGSIAAIFSTLLHEVATSKKVVISDIYRHPIKWLAGLERYNTVW